MRISISSTQPLAHFTTAGESFLVQGSAGIEYTWRGTARRLSLAGDQPLRLAGDSLACQVARGNRQRPELCWQIARSPHGLLLQLTVSNTLQEPIGLEKIQVLTGAAGVTLAGDQTLVAHPGWQGWGLPASPRPMEALPRMPAPVKFPLSGEYNAGVAPEVAFWVTPDGVLTLGFTRAERFHGVIEWTRGGSLSAWLAGEGRLLQPGESLASEPLLLSLAGEYPTALEEYAAAVVAQVGRRPAGGPPPVAWTTWSFYSYDDIDTSDRITAAALPDNLAILGQRFAGLVNVVQIDDGFQPLVGDWFDSCAGFPEGITASLQAIRQAGFTPGLWLAPLVLNQHSCVYREHPDWVVRDEAGQPICVKVVWGGDNYALDVTHSGAAAWLAELIGRAVHEWQAPYLKLDFLYAGALPGVRHAPYTSLEAYRAALAIMRQAAGDAVLIGCGAPLLASAGPWFDGMRVGLDTPSIRWKVLRDGTPFGLVPFLDTLLARNWLRALWPYIDPDSVTVRQEKTEFDPSEVRSILTVAALTGTMLELGDRLPRLDEKQLDLLAFVLPPLVASRRVTGVRVNTENDRLCLAAEGAEGPLWLLATFNPDDAPQPARFEPAAWGLPAGRYLVYDVWDGRLEVAEAALPLPDIPPRAIRLLSVRPCLDRPQVAGSTLHLGAGLLEVAGVEWSADTFAALSAGAGLLSLRVTSPNRRAGEVLVYAPPGWAPASGNGTIPHAAGGSILRLPVSPTDEEQRFTLSFRRDSTAESW